MYPTRIKWVPASGVLSSALGSSADMGRWLVNDVISGIVAAPRLAHQSGQQLQGHHKLESLAACG
jgi:hypothetical protein